MADNNPSWTGLTDQEAEEFHKYYLQGATIFTLVAVVAHILVWMWRPWIPDPRATHRSWITQPRWQVLSCP
jgi:light-harvesting complex 1 beta chain